MLSQEIKDEMLDIYLRYTLLGERPIYKCYYFDYKDNQIVLTGFVDEPDVYKYWKKNGTLVIDDVFEVIDMNTKMKYQDCFPYQDLSNYNFYVLKLGKNVQCIRQLHIWFKLFYKIETDSVLTIDKCAFSYENNLVEFKGEFVKSIKEKAFFGSHNLAVVLFPKCEIVENSAFGSCYRLEYVDISSIQDIPRYLCGDCPNIKTFIAPNATSIHEYLFTFSKHIETIKLGLINYIEKDAFFHTNLVYSKELKKVIIKNSI